MNLPVENGLFLVGEILYKSADKFIRETDCRFSCLFSLKHFFPGCNSRAEWAKRGCKLPRLNIFLEFDVGIVDRQDDGSENARGKSLVALQKTFTISTYKFLFLFYKGCFKPVL
jgi:hypothetical protein